MYLAASSGAYTYSALAAAAYGQQTVLLEDQLAVTGVVIVADAVGLSGVELDVESTVAFYHEPC